MKFKLPKGYVFSVLRPTLALFLTENSFRKLKEAEGAFDGENIDFSNLEFKDVLEMRSGSVAKKSLEYKSLIFHSEPFNDLNLEDLNVPSQISKSFLSIKMILNSLDLNTIEVKKPLSETKAMLSEIKETPEILMRNLLKNLSSYEFDLKNLNDFDFLKKFVIYSGFVDENKTLNGVFGITKKNPFSPVLTKIFFNFLVEAYEPNNKYNVFGSGLQMSHWKNNSSCLEHWVLGLQSSGKKEDLSLIADVMVNFFDFEKVKFHKNFNKSVENVFKYLKALNYSLEEVDAFKNTIKSKALGTKNYKLLDLVDEIIVKDFSSLVTNTQKKDVSYIEDEIVYRYKLSFDKFNNASTNKITVKDLKDFDKSFFEPIKIFFNNGYAQNFLDIGNVEAALTSKNLIRGDRSEASYVLDLSCSEKDLEAVKTVMKACEVGFFNMSMQDKLAWNSNNVIDVVKKHLAVNVLDRVIDVVNNKPMVNDSDDYGGNKFKM